MPEIINNVLCPECTGWHPADAPCPCEPVQQIPGQLNIMDALNHPPDGLEHPYEPGPTKDENRVVRSCPGGGREPTSMVTVATGGLGHSTRGACAGCRKAVLLAPSKSNSNVLVCVPHDVIR